MIAIIDYKAGNLTSVRNAFSALRQESVITSDPEIIRKADYVVFPGVGAAFSAMENLRKLKLTEVVKEVAVGGKPFLGICLGMQILFEHSEEDGGVELLGVLPGNVKKFSSAAGCKIPEIGWNKVNKADEYYFVHSYYAETGDFTVGRAAYAGVEFSAAVRRDNLLACQFHPEKSGKAGLKLLESFLRGDLVGCVPLAEHGETGALTRRVIPCLDVRNGIVTKGVKFKNNIDLGDPVEMAVKYSEGGADELVFYDITASAERRPIDIEMVRSVAKAVRIPFAVGGGISSVADMERVILAGAEKISVNSLAVRNPEIIREGAAAFGRQCVVLGMDPVRSEKCPSGYEITTRGFREMTGMDAVEWAKRAEELGAGEIVVNSVDADGTRGGFELEITKKIADAVGIPVVASGGAGKPEHLVEVFAKANADAAIVAGMIHTGDWTIAQIKETMAKCAVPVRLRY